MTEQLSEILSEITIKTRNSTTGALDNQKRTTAINRTLDDLQDYADWKFTRRIKKFDFIDGVYEYNLKDYIGCSCFDNDGSTSVTDFKTPYDLRPENEKSIKYTEDSSVVREEIRRGRCVTDYSIDSNLLVAAYPRQSSIQLHNCDSLTADGTIAASGDATNLTIDTIELKEGGGALNFDTSSGSSLIITFTGISNKDLTALQNKSHALVKAYLPTITGFSNITLKWGSDSSNYWSKAETLPAANNELQADWNTFAFKWANATQTGSPTVSSIDYLQVIITYSSPVTATDFRLDDIRIGKAVKMELEYYSLAMVLTTAGAYKLRFDTDAVTMTDKLLGGTTARNTITAGGIYECFEIIGGKSERDVTDAFNKYEQKKIDLLKKAGNRIRRGIKVLNFQRR